MTTPEQYDWDDCIDCDDPYMPFAEDPGTVMGRQLPDGSILLLCAEHADMRRARGEQNRGSQPPRRLKR